MKNITKILSIVGIIGIFLSTNKSVFSKGAIGYNSIGISYNFTNFDEDGLDDANGIGLDLVIAPFNHVYFISSASWSKYEDTFDSIDIDNYNLSIGVGLNTSTIAELIDLYADVSLLFSREDDSFDESDIFGVGLSIGAEFSVLESLTLNANVNFAYLDVDEGDSDSLDFGIGTAYNIFDPISIYAEINIDKDSNKGFSIGLAYGW